MEEDKKRLALHWKILIGMLLGIIWAYFSIDFGWNQFTKDWISPFGEMFIRGLKFIAVPLVLFSIIVGVSGLKDIGKLGRLGVKTLGMYLLTTVVAVTLGLTLVNVFEPGNTVSQEQRVRYRIEYELWVKSQDGVDFKDDLRLSEQTEYASLVADIEQKNNRTEEQLTPDELKEKKKVEEKLATATKKQEAGPLSTLVDMIPENIVISLQNPGLMLQVIFFAIFFAICLLMIPAVQADPVIRFFGGLNEVFLKMVDVIMKASPFFVFCLMSGVLSKMANTKEDLFDTLFSLGAYSIVVVTGLLIMILVYPLLVSLLVKRMRYGSFWKKISPAQLMAFSTSSSAATLPVTMECVEEGVGVKPAIASFVLPVGATVNMDGTSLYQAVAVIFLAQLHMIDLSFGEQALIVFTATMASIGSAAVPSAGLVMLMIVLTSVGLNPVWIAIILPVDRILDMCRTVVNVTGDATVATIIASSEGELKEAE